MRASWEHQLRSAQARAGTPRRAALWRVGDATRTVIERLVATRAPDAELDQAAERLEAVAQALEGWPQGRLYEGFAESANAGRDVAFLDHSPVMGRANPLAAPIVMDVVEGLVTGRVAFGSAYEGPPGCVHGGFLAAAFDEVLGLAQSMTGNPGMTASLGVSYRRPTPLHAELTFQGELVRVEGRKIFTHGRCLVGDRLTAEADALFISVDMARLAELQAARQSGQGARGTGPTAPSPASGTVGGGGPPLGRHDRPHWLRPGGPDPP